jgi:glutamate--cysteine ligase
LHATGRPDRPPYSQDPPPLSRPVHERLSALINAGGETLLGQGRTGLEKESLRVGPDGSIAQTPHPATLGSALTHPWITTDYSEALLELITPPLPGPVEALAFLRNLEQFVYAKIDRELLWCSSMPCVVAGEESIPVAQYGISNAGFMKTVYRRGLGYRYGRVMQVIAGAHYNYSFAEGLWPVYQPLLEDPRPARDFISDTYFAVIRNLQRVGWLIPYLFGSSPAICKSFMCGKPTKLESFNEGSYYGPYATSLRMCDIGYQNRHEYNDGFKACYDNLDRYVETLTRAIETPCPSHEKVGVKIDGEYRQLNPNILQIENEYYSSVRPKQVPGFLEKPTLALKRRGVRYIELRSMDINVYEPIGIGEQQCRFAETLMALCLLQESPLIDAAETREIDANLDAVCYRGRQPGLKLRRQGRPVTLKRWAGEICATMADIAAVLDAGEPGTPYQDTVRAQQEAIADPERTPSARILADMRAHGEGYFDFANRLSRQHRDYFLALPRDPERFYAIETAVAKSIRDQERLEASDAQSFDEFLRDYFAQRL